MNNENVEDDKAKLMQMLDDEPPYDRERFEERRKATEGQWLEMVTMKDDMSLSIVTAQYFVGGGVGNGSSNSAPGDSDYEELLAQHGPLKPGDSHTLIRKKVDGEWVVQAG